MLCLKCAQENQHPGPECVHCGNVIGYLAENRGYLPQLEALQEELQHGEATPAQAAERLQRLEQALQMIIAHMDDTGVRLAAMDLDEGQQGTLGGFLMPVREGLANMLDAVTGLDPSGRWSEQQWESLREAQLQVVRGNEGVAYVAEAVAVYAAEAGVQLTGE